MNSKKHALLLFTLFISLSSFGQIRFEKGYFISNNNNRTECLIKNVDWKDNPSGFNHKLSENAPVKHADIEGIQAFEIDGTTKFVRHYVDIDRSTNIVEQMSDVRNAEFKRDTLFLKVLLEGKADLFIYEGENVVRYFYSLDDGNPVQLVYKKFRIDHSKIGTNNGYKQQLWNDLKCEDIKQKMAFGTAYSKNDLIKYFTQYNACHQAPTKSYHLKEKRTLYNLYARAGINFSSASFKAPLSEAKTDFGSKISPRFGLENEFILPFHKNRWAVLAEVSYRSFKGSSTYYFTNGALQDDSQEVTFKLSTIEFPIGVRHYFFLNNTSKVFLNLLFVPSISFDSYMDFERRNNAEINSRSNFALGAGYNFKNRVTVEFRHNFNRRYWNYKYWDSYFSNSSINIGIGLFSVKNKNR